MPGRRATDIGDALRTWGRRAASITLYASLALLGWLGLPLLLPLAAFSDLLRGDRRWARTRCLIFALVYLSCEIAGIVASLGLWLWGLTLRERSREGEPASGSLAHRLTGAPARYLDATFRLQCWWARTLFHAAARIFAMRTEVEGDEAVRRGPFLLFMRHASIGDTMLPAVFIAGRHRIVLRWVMKHELLWDPCLDIVGNRLPNYFVRRGSGESEKEIAALQRLTEHLGTGDGVLIYPEGTRFSPAKRERALARLEGAATPRILSMARTLRWVLPPRLGGALGLLEANPGADAVFCAHVGLEGTAAPRDILAGAPIGQVIRVRFWRVPFAQIPNDAGARGEWLYEQWQRVDAWIAEQRGEASEAESRMAGAPVG